MSNLTTQAGFSAVELLITLFIAVSFIGAGYQLYGIAIKDGYDARIRAQASSIAYAQLRTSSASVASLCSADTYPVDVSASGGIGVTQMTVAITCPYGTNSTISAVTISLPYGNDSPKQKVVHALYATAQ